MEEYKKLIIEVYYGSKDSIIDDIDYISLNDNIVEIHYSNAEYGEDIEEINIHELANKCLIHEWDNMYEVTLRVMGAEVVSLKTGYSLHIVQREDIGNAEKFDPRFIFKACQWILENNKDK